MILYKIRIYFNIANFLYYSRLNGRKIRHTSKSKRYRQSSFAIPQDRKGAKRIKTPVCDGGFYVEFAGSRVGMLQTIGCFSNIIQEGFRAPLSISIYGTIFHLPLDDKRRRRLNMALIMLHLMTLLWTIMTMRMLVTIWEMTICPWWNLQWGRNTTRQYRRWIR